LPTLPGARRLALAGALALTIGAGAVAGCGSDAGPPRARLWTLFDFDRLARGAGDGPPPLVAGGAGLPSGLPVSHFVTETSAGPELTLGTTFAGGYRNSYFTTELWAGFDEVWVQPAYVPITGVDDSGQPQKLLGADGAWHPIFSVGPASAFYSPYWQIIYFQVPAGTAPDKYTSATQVLDSGLPLTPAEAEVMTLAPDGTVLPDTTRAIAKPPRQQGWLDGAPIAFFALGTRTFQWGPDRVVGEVPQFQFTMRNADGQLVLLDVPSVSGPGPVGHAGAPPVMGNPLYGGLWRVYTVELPPTARVFAPSLYTDLEARLAAQKIPVVGQYPDPVNTTMSADTEVVVGRVALNPDCFADPNNAASTIEGSQCVWLDSETQVETLLDPATIKRTGLLITCPFVSYRDMPVSL
jgi:hypothetical protein